MARADLVVRVREVTIVQSLIVGAITALVLA